MFTQLVTLLLIINFFLFQSWDISCAQHVSTLNLSSNIYPYCVAEQLLCKALGESFLVFGGTQYRYKSINMPSNHTYFSKNMFSIKPDARFNQLHKKFNEGSQDFSIMCAMIYKEYTKNRTQNSKKCIDNALIALKQIYSTLYESYSTMYQINNSAHDMFIDQVIKINKKLQKILCELNSIRRTYEILIK